MRAIATPRDELGPPRKCLVVEGGVDTPPLRGSLPDVGMPCRMTPTPTPQSVGLPLRSCAGRWGAFSGKAAERIAAIYSIYSVQRLMSVTALRRGLFEL